MSAFLVSPSSIDSIVSSIAFGQADYSPRAEYQASAFRRLNPPYHLVAGPVDPMGKLEFQRLAFDLHRLNVQALNHRYSEETPANYTPAIHASKSLATDQLYKSVRCLIYQCAEGPAMESPLWKALEAFGSELAHEIATSSPGWQNAAWK